MEIIYQLAINGWSKLLEWGKKEKNQERLVLTCFGISLIPLLILSFYNHPAMDDFNYGVLTRWAVEAHSGLGCVIPVLKAAVERAVHIWNVWQGTFSFSFLAALRPSVLTEKLTFIQTFILLGVFVTGFWYFFQVVLHRLLGFSRAVASITVCVALTLCIQYVPYGVEAFYWWNGSIGYTGLFAVMLLMFGLILSGMQDKKISWKRMVSLVVLCVILSGGMYPVALLTGVLLAMALLDVLVGKQYGRCLKLQILLLNVIYYAGFVLSMIAPGNERRQRFFVPDTPFGAIYKSYLECLAYMREQTNAVIILAIAGLFLYMLYQMGSTRFSFGCPLLFTFVTYSLVTVMWVPGLFAVKFISGGRYYNILYYGMVLFYVANAIYYAGWLRRRYEACTEPAQSFFRSAKSVLLGTAGICCVVTGMVKLDIVRDLEEITTATALKSLVYGEARVYHEEMKAREELYHDPKVQVVEVEELTYKPELLYWGTLTTDPENSQNQAMCRYYGKESMVLLGSEETEEKQESSQ